MKDRTVANHARRKYAAYIYFVCFVGLCLITTSLFSVHQFENKFNFILLTALVAASSLAVSSRTMFGRLSLAYDVGSGVSIAAIPAFGLPGIIVINAVIALVPWLWLYRKYSTWRKSAEQLFFNAGMLSIASVPAWLVYRLIDQQVSSADASLIWGSLAAAVVYELANRTMVLAAAYTQHNGEISFGALFLDGWSDTLLTMTVNFVGAALVGYALAYYDWRGVVIFFVPVLLSALAFLIYVRNAGVYLDNLESLVAERTGRLQTLQQDKDRFLRILTHDMRAPLAVIRNYTHLLKQNPEQASLQPRWLDNLAAAEAALSRLVSDIGDLEHWSVGHEPLGVLSDVDVSESLVQTIELNRSIADAKAQKLTINHPQSPALIHGDPAQIARIFGNLVSNAIKYTPHGGHISASIRPIGGFVSVDIQDTGYGIPKPDIDNVFSESFRVAAHQHLASGTGVGLAVVKMLVEAHNGTISVNSTPNKGSTFTVTFPLKAA